MSRRRSPRHAVLRLTTAQAVRSTVHRYPDQAPVLAVDCGAVTVLLTPDGPVTPDDLAFARQLVRESARYARAVEKRLRHLTAEIPTDDTRPIKAVPNSTAA